MKSKYNKFKAIKSGGYDSKKEHKRALQLELLERGKVIKDLQKQVRFQLQESFKNNKGESIRKIEYVADFVYYDNEKKTKVIEDSKGFKTKDYMIKAKILQFKYPEYLFIES